MPLSMIRGMGRGAIRKGGSREVTTFQILSGNSSISNLPTTLLGLTPNFLYEGKNASTSGWTATIGEDLSAVGTDNPTPNLDGPLTDSSDKVVRLAPSAATAKSYRGANNTYLDIPGQDLIVEGLVETTSSTVGMVAKGGYGGSGFGCILGATVAYTASGPSAKAVAVPNGEGWALFQAAISSQSPYPTRVWVNGVPYGLANHSSPITTDLTQPVYVGEWYGGTSPGGLSYGFLQGWHGTAILPATLSDLDATMAERFYRLAGVWPLVAKGSPTATFTRGSSAYLDKLTFGEVTKLYKVGAGWPRVCERRDDGPLDVENDIPYSEALNSNPDALFFSCSITDDALDFPLGGKASALVADVTDGYHLFSALTHVVAGTGIHVFSAYVKAATQRYIILGALDVDIFVSTAVIFDLQTGTMVYEQGNPVATRISAVDGAAGWYRVMLAYDAGTVANHTHVIGPHNAATPPETSFTGDGVTADLYIYGMQHEELHGRPVAGVLANPYVRTAGIKRQLGRSFVGYLPEEAATNLVTNTNTLSGWINFQVTSSALADTVDGPGITLISAPGNGAHGAYVLPTLSAVPYRLSMFAKSRTGTHLALMINDIGQGCSYDLINGVSGVQLSESAGAISSHGMESMGGGWWRCWLKATPLAGTCVVVAGVASQAGAISWLDSGEALSVDLFGMCLTTLLEDTSYISSGAAPTVRAADKLTYVGLANLGGAGDRKKGSIEAEILLSDKDLAAAGVVVKAYDDSDAASHVTLQVDATGDVANLAIAGMPEATALVLAADKVNPTVPDTASVTIDANQTISLAIEVSTSTWFLGATPKTLFSVGNFAGSSTAALVLTILQDAVPVKVLVNTWDSSLANKSAFGYLPQDSLGSSEGLLTHRFGVEYNGGGYPRLFVDGAEIPVIENGGPGTGIIDQGSWDIPLGIGHWVVTYDDFPGTVHRFAVAQSTMSELEARLVDSTRYPSMFDKKILALGDSITYGTGSTAGDPTNAYLGTMLATLGSPWQGVNAGHGGYRTDQLIPILNSYSKSYFDTAVILAGVNNVTQGTPLVQAKLDLRAMYDACYIAGMKVIACTILPVNNPIYDSGIEEMNDWIRLQSDVLVIDTWASFVDVDGHTLKAIYDSGDGIHPNQTGHNLLASLIGAQINAGYKPGIIAGTTDVVDGIKHTIKSSWRVGNGEIKVDNAREGRRSITIVPADLDKISVGYDGKNDSNWINGLVPSVIIKNK